MAKKIIIGRRGLIFGAAASTLFSRQLLADGISGGVTQQGSGEIDRSVGTGIGGSAGRIAPIYLGQVATRAYVPMTTNAGIPTSQTRSRHFSRDAIKSLQIAIPNWYVNSSTFVETGPGGSATVTASIEYPSGTFTQVTFGGSPTGTVANLGTLFSDMVGVAIPINTEFWVRIWRSCASGIVFTGSIAQDTANGDFFRYGAAQPDLTMGGAIVSSDASNMAFPAAILAYTAKASVALVGDSRVAGLNDTFSDTSGDKGELARAIGPTLGYINMGVPSDQATLFVASHARRQQLAAFCTSIAVEYGINDLANGRSDAQLRADMLAIAGYFTSQQKVVLCTMPPSTTGAWTAADGSDQTVKSFEALRTANNDWRRTIPAPYRSNYEIADVMEISRNNGKWKAPGFTADGVHESNAALITLRDSGAIVLSALAR